MLVFINSSSVIDSNLLIIIITVLSFAVLSEFLVRRGQSGIVGILLFSIILSNIFGLHYWANNQFVKFMSEIGAIIILLESGLESDLHDLKSKFSSGLLVAVVGVIAPLIMISIAVYFLFGHDAVVAILAANVLVATSVAVTADSFKQFNAEKSTAAGIIMVAAVIDDILGMLLLGIIEPLVSSHGTYSVTHTLLQIFYATIFIVGGIFIGRWAANNLSKLFTLVFHSGNKGALYLTLLICSLFLLAACFSGLALIIGAFTAGLVLDHTHFKNFHKAENKVEQLIKPIKAMTMPFFFASVGISVNIGFLLSDTGTMGINWFCLIMVVLLFLLATLGKMLSGFVKKFDGNSIFGKTNWTIGIGMNPRGEVGMIIALLMVQLGLFTSELYGILIMVIFLTTILSPIIMGQILKRS